MNVLALNAGSSSLKASLFALDASDLDASDLDASDLDASDLDASDLGAAGADGAPAPPPLWEAEGGAGHEALGDALGDVLGPLWAGPGAPLPGPGAVDAVGHRVVHGGAALRESARVTPAVEAAIAAAAEYAPAHNAPALALMRAAERLFGAARPGGVPQVAVFDTAFHRTLAPAAYAYPGPYAWLAEGIRRYGFHGINHEYASHRAARLLGREPADDRLRVVSCHLGSGCSLAAVRGGRSVDTTMGFTPLDGLPMARRSGAVDPGIVLHLLRDREHTVDSLDRLLNHDSGLAGLSGTSGDMREVLAGVDAGDARAALAFDVFVRRVAQGVAAMAAGMGGVDAVVFTGGVGEHAPRVRAAVVAALGFLGAAVDPARNAAPAGDAEVSAAGAGVRVFVIPAQENWMIARECVRLVAGASARITG